MNKLTTYEQQLSNQLSNLPLPNEDFAWAQMKKLLQDDDDDKIVPPPILNKGCGLLIALGILLLGIGGYFYYNKNKTASVNKTSTENVVTVKTDSEQIETLDSSNKIILTNNDTSKIITTENNSDNKLGRVITDSSNKKNNIDLGTKDAENIGTSTKIKYKTNRKAKVKITAPNAYSDDVIGNEKLTSTLNASNPKKRIKIKGKSKVKTTAPNLVEDDEETNTAKDLTTKDTQPIDEKVVTKTDKISTTVKKDSTKKIDTLATKKEEKINDTLAKKEPTKKEIKQKYIWYSAGIAVQQPFPLKGESPVLYNMYGRKNAITDYIPSIYFRVNKDEKWFAQAEFRYGVPQYVKEFSFSKKFDTSGSFGKTRTAVLKKTYYHQIPLSYHVYILKNWSVGGGVIYNKFSAAISQEDTRNVRFGVELDTITNSTTSPHTYDSFFVKNNFQWMVETQYKWRRFSVGARFSMDVNPYINYTDPVTKINISKRNQAFNAFLRYQLWRSKRKK